MSKNSRLLPDGVVGISHHKWVVKTRKEAIKRLNKGKGTFIRERIEILPKEEPK